MNHKSCDRAAQREAVAGQIVVSNLDRHGLVAVNELTRQGLVGFHIILHQHAVGVGLVHQKLNHA